MQIVIGFDLNYDGSAAVRFFKTFQRNETEERDLWLGVCRETRRSKLVADEPTSFRFNNGHVETETPVHSDARACVSVKRDAQRELDAPNPLRPDESRM